MTVPSSAEAGNQPEKSLLKRFAARLLEIARQKDTPHNIGLGLALGIFIGILPIMGIQMSVVAILAIPFRANIKAAVAGVWVSNPITFLPMYWGYYKLGLLFFPSKAVSWDDFINMIKEAGEIDWSSITESLGRILNIGADILIPMWTGAFILAVIFAPPTYFITKRAVKEYRKRKGERVES